MLNLKNYLLIIQSPKDYYQYDPHSIWDKYFIPGRIIPMAFPGKTTIVLPGNNPDIKKFVSFCEQVLFNNKKISVLWTSGKNYTLDRDIILEILPEIQNLVYKQKTTIFPYSTTTLHFIDLIKQIKGYYEILGDDIFFASKYANKGIIHRAISELNKPSFCEQEQISCVSGFTCRDNNELIKAYELLHTQTIIKPVYGGGGMGIEEVKSQKQLKHYKFKYGPVILEKKLDIDIELKRNLKKICNFHFLGYRHMGLISSEINKYYRWVGNYYPALVDNITQQKVLSEAFKLHAALVKEGLKGPGGFDFAIANNKPYLIDINLGRITGHHPIKFFQYFYTPNSCYVYGNNLPQKKVDIFLFWQYLQKNKMAFNKKTGIGVFPLFFMKEFCAIVSFHKIISKAEENYLKAIAILY